MAFSHHKFTIGAEQTAGQVTEMPGKVGEGQLVGEYKLTRGPLRAGVSDPGGEWRRDTRWRLSPACHGGHYRRSR
jgi:hypothetical protein